ncbi:hypothetical protein G7Z17_g2746 [Cylindrodendrum hubeiense]|uniref:NB-ARC domain-containing protein n=1 Tax=Cylindrodendrum hubeiense TaxID=595255 RepID=A0A9P5LIV2_9HYPO|nr:hypothetical protein G7Z17_g2746 [Cylindrodendrum hubeiense]
MRHTSRRTNTEESGQSSASATLALGLEEWYNGDDPDVDIIFIHGLMGHREKTWRGTADDGRKLEPWPRTLLPSIIPNSRIFTFGYDAHVVNWKEMQGKVSVKAIRDHAKELVSSIEHERNQTNTTGRPMIFVCHSLGGLVCKDAIVFSAQRRDRKDLVDFSQHTAGIIFMGTPHRGSAIADHAARFTGLVGSFKQTNPKLLRVLQAESDTLQLIHEDFYDLVNGRRTSANEQDIQVMCFWEELPSPITGSIVPRESAVLPGFGDRGIHADHKGMTKFSSASDPGYQSFLQELKAVISKTMQWGAGPPRTDPPARHNRTSPVFPPDTNTMNANCPWFLVPYARNELFAGRSAILQQLSSWIGSPVENRQRGIHKRAALHGLGGIGKTQVVLEWAYEMRERDEDLSIFWVHASTTERFTEAYTSIARTCQIPGHSIGGSDLLKRVKEWLESSHQQHPWLMIVDNADDIQVFLEKSEDAGYLAKMHKYLPSSPNGSVLFTSRSKQAAVDLTEGRSLIAVTEPSPEECIEMIRGRLSDYSHTTTDIESLAKELGYLPLALSQAISYLQKKSLSVPQYLETLRAGSGDSLMRMLQDDFTEAGRNKASENQVPNAVARTWLVSFRAIEQENSLAIELLYLLHLALQWELKRSGHLAEYAVLSMLVLHQELPNLSAETTLRTTKMIPHINTSLDCGKGLAEVDRYWPSVTKAVLLSGIAWFMNSQRIPLRESEWMWLEAIKRCEETVGPAVKTTLTAKRRFADCLKDEGEYEKAVELLESVYELSEALEISLGVGEPLSQAYTMLGRIGDAARFLDMITDLYYERADEPVVAHIAKARVECNYQNIAERGGLMALQGQLDNSLALQRWLLHKVGHLGIDIAFRSVGNAIHALTATGGHDNENEALALQRVWVQLSAHAYGAHHQATLYRKATLNKLISYMSKGRPLHQVSEITRHIVKVADEERMRRDHARRSPRLDAARAEGRDGDSAVDARNKEEPPPSDSQFIMGIINEYRLGHSDVDNLPDDDWRKPWAWTHYEPFRQAWLLIKQSYHGHDSEEETSETSSFSKDIEQESSWVDTDDERAE